MEEAKTVKAIAETSLSRETEKILSEIHDLLAKANEENPKPVDLQALSDLLHKNKDLGLWKRIMGVGALAEHNALENNLGTKAKDRSSVGS